MINRRLGKRRLSLLSVMMLIFVLVAFSICEAADTSKVKKLKWATFLAENSYQSPALKQMRDDIENFTHGAVKVKLYWSGQIAETKDLPDLCRTGAVEIITTSPNYAASLYPLNSSLQGFPLLFKGVEQAQYTWLKLFRNFPEIQREFAKQNSFGLNRQAMAQFLLLSSKPIRNVDDLKGLKIRTFPNKYYSNWMKALGAANLNVMMPELYESLMRGVLDGTATNVQFAQTLKFYEVAKYISFDLGTIVGPQTTINLNVWNGFTPEVKRAITRAAVNFGVNDLEINLVTEKDSIEFLKQKGVEFIKIDEKDYKAFYDAGGNPWEGLKDSLVNDMRVDEPVADEFIKRWRESIDEYDREYRLIGKKWEYK